MPFVQAKCPECGGMLAVDEEKRLAVCQFCGEPFVVQEAVNNYNTYNTTNNNYNTTHNYGEGTTVNVYEDTNKDFVIEAGVLKEYHGESVDVIIPDTVLEISSKCFEEMNLSSIKLPKSLKHLYDVDENLFKLKVELDSDNPYMIIKDNLILNKDETRVEAFITTNGETSFSIPNTIDSLSKTAKRQQNYISHIFYKSYDLKNLNCYETEIIEFSKKMGISFNIKHNPDEEFKCVDCKKYIVSSMPIECFHYSHYSSHADVEIGFVNEETAVFGNNSINNIEYLDGDISCYNNSRYYIDKIREKLTKSQKEKFDKVRTLIILNLNENGGVLYSGGPIKSIGVLLLALFSNVNKIIIEEDTTCYDYKKEKRISVIHDIIVGYIWHQYTTFEEDLCLSYNDNLPSDTIEPLKKLKDEIKDKIDEKVELCKQQALKEQLENQRKQWIAAGKCQYCGGEFNLFKKCKFCGWKKDY